MSLIEKAIYTKLSGLVSGRVYPARAPDNELNDFIVFQKTDSDRWRDLEAPSGMAQAYIQVDCYSQRYYNAKETAVLVENILDGFRGVVSYGTDSPQESIRIGATTLQSEFEDLDRTDEPFLYKTTMTFLVTYEQG